MNHTDAAKVLNLNGEINPENVKKAYQRAAAKYHPDRNPGGTEMMKAVNAAYAVLKDYEGELEHEANLYGDELMEKLNAVMVIVGQSAGKVKAEIMGAWIWVTGDTRPYSAQLNRKTGAGFSYASKKKAWYFRPDDYRSSSRGSYSLDDIRATHGSREAGAKYQTKLERA